MGAAVWELQNEIAGLLTDFRGEEPLKKLFWTTLGYDRVEVAIPQRLLASDLASRFHEVRLLAEYKGLNVLYARMTSQDDGALAMRALAGRIRQVMPYALVVFSDSGQTAWTFTFHRVNRDGLELRHIQIGPEADSPFRLAAQLVRLRTYSEDGKERPLAGLLNAYDAVFGRGRSRWRRRLERSEDLIGIYIRDMSRYPLMFPDEEKSLAARMRVLMELPKSNPQAQRELKEIRDSMVLANLRLAVWIAKPFWRHRPLRHLEPLDLVQAGNLGLLRAAERFDPTRGTRFDTYAYWWVEQFVRREIECRDSLVAVPNHLLRPYWKGEISDPRLLWQIRAAFGCRSCTFATIPDVTAETAEHSVARADRLAAMLEVVDRLGARQSTVIRLRYGLAGGKEQTLDEVGAVVKLTRERVRQIENKALKRLAFLLKPDGSPSGRKEQHART